jgi:hypothetical protein
MLHGDDFFRLSAICIYGSDTGKFDFALRDESLLTNFCDREIGMVLELRYWYKERKTLCKWVRLNPGEGKLR